MWADAAAGQQQRIAFANRMHGAFIVAFFDLADIARNIDLGRAGLLAGCQGIVFLVEMQQAFRHGADTYNILGAGFFTGPAPHTHGFIHDREAVWSHMYGVEAAGRDAVALAEATDAADPVAAVHGGQRLAAVDTVIKKMVVGAITAGAFIFRHQGFGTARIDAHYPGDRNGGFHAGYDTDAGRGLAIDDRYGRRRTTGIATATAIGAGEKIFDSRRCVGPHIRRTLSRRH